MKNLKFYHYIVICLFIICLFAVIRNIVVKQDLINHGILINVRIIEYLPPGKGMTDANYLCEFTYNGKVKRLISQSRIQYKKRQYEGEYFPAMYSEKADELRILMKPEDFEEFSLKYPDSLIGKVRDISEN